LAELDYDLNFDRHGAPTTFYGMITFVTASGDQLYGYFFCRYDSPNTFAGEIVFLGGTGPYRNASGEAELTGTAFVVPVEFFADFTGELKLKNNRKGD